MLFRIAGVSVTIFPALPFSYIPSAQPMCYIITNTLHWALFYKTTTALNCDYKMQRP